MKGIHLSLHEMARAAWLERISSHVVGMSRWLTNLEPTVREKVQTIVEWVRIKGLGPDPGSETFRLRPPFDADDAVLTAATLCLAAGIRCRIVGARFGQSWTCWLAYEDDTDVAYGVEPSWVTVDVFGTGKAPDREPDESIEVDCGPPVVDATDPEALAAALKRAFEEDEQG